MPSVREALRALDLDEELVEGLGAADDLRAVWWSCERGEWLMRLALRVGVDRRLLVRAAVFVASRAADAAGGSEPRRGAALEAARRWSEGEDNHAECFAAAFAAAAAAEARGEDRSPAAAAARAAAAVAFACDAEADLAYYADRAYVADAIVLGAAALGDTPQARAAVAEMVRSFVGFDWVDQRLGAAVRASQRPPPPSPLRQSHVTTPAFREESSPGFSPRGGGAA